MRMIEVNILNTIKTIKYSIENGSKKYFCVSTDKASIPVNMMGASKKIMEMFLMKFSDKLKISTSRFANVAFSDGSLLYSFKQRLKKQQPIVAPNDVKRYFILPKEAGELCLMSCIFGDNRDVFFPKMDRNKNLISFSDIAINFLREMDYEPIIYSSEKEVLSHKKIKNKWPCFFTKSDTTGEKYIEEFYSKDENLNLNLFKDIGVIKNSININNKKLDNFLKKISSFRKKSNYNKIDIVKLFEDILTDFKHIEKNKFLDSKL